MKKITYIALAIVLCLAAFGVVGCGEDEKDEFIEIQSITYAVGSEVTTLTSAIEFLNRERINKSEYDLFEDSYKIDYTIILSPSIKADKSNLPNIEPGSLIAFDCYGQYKATIEYNYVLFQKIDEKTIRIKHDGKEFEVMADSYQVTYFN